jgi:acetoin utilization deacetylase AcuC-like enzyme
MKAVKERLVPAIRAFAPNLLIMSAGFDAAETDLGNVGVDRRGERKVGVNLQPKDYEEMTARLVEAVESCPEAKGVVSILEGGYGSYDASSGLDRDILAKCCVSHVKGLSSFGFDKSTYP